MVGVFANCKKCDWRIGSFLNLWTKIGKSYISPIVKRDQELNIISSGSVRSGEEQTLVDRWYVLDYRYLDRHSLTQKKTLVDLKIYHAVIAKLFWVSSV
jgi:hypothetical protein